MPKILIVDDDEDIVETTKFFLEAAGYECLAALNGLEGLRQALEKMPDLVLLDVMMPVIDGIEMLRVMRESSALNPTPVIMLTAISEKAQVMGILALGVADYIVKPFDHEALIEKIKNILGEPEKPATFSQEEDIARFKISRDTGGDQLSAALMEIFAQIARLTWQGRRKFIIDFGDLNEVDPAALRIIGDGIGEANAESVDLKFVIPSEKLKKQFLSFYETGDADIYNSEKEARKACREEKGFKTTERDGIVVLTIKNSGRSLPGILDPMVKYVYKAAAEGRRRFIINLEHFGNLDRLEPAEIKLIGDGFLEMKERKARLKFVIPSKIVKAHFQGFYETKDMEICFSEEEAVQEFKREEIFSLIETDEVVIITTIEKCGPAKSWKILKDVFRRMFELVGEGRKNFIINLAEWSEIDIKILKLIEGAMSAAKAGKVNVGFVSSSRAIADRFQCFPGTRGIALCASVEEARQHLTRQC